MTLGRKILLALSMVVFMTCVSCSDDKQEGIVGDSGMSLAFLHVPADTVMAGVNDYYASLAELKCADLRVIVRSALVDDKGNDTTNPYYLKGNEKVERLLNDYIIANSKYKFDGFMPEAVYYTTEPCQYIRITLIKKDGSEPTDITHLARFYYLYATPDGAVNNLYVDSEMNRVGRIPLNATIEEYLSLSPMVFTHAHFIFPDVEKSVFEGDSQVKVEIGLGDGRVLTQIASY